jgi:hypothetical protein
MFAADPDFNWENFSISKKDPPGAKPKVSSAFTALLEWFRSFPLSWRNLDQSADNQGKKKSKEEAMITTVLLHVILKPVFGWLNSRMDVSILA